MAKIFGLIPDREKVRELEKFYKIMGNRIKDEIAKIDAGEWSEIRAIAVQKNVGKIVDMMNRFAFQWPKRTILEIYKEATKRAKVSLDVLGTAKDPLYDSKKHMRAVEKYNDLIAEDLVKANNSVRQNIATYIYLTRRASEKIAHIEEFDLRSEETISELLDDAIRAGASRSKLQSLIRIHFKRELYERKFININGRNYDMIRYAETVARTRLRDVQSDAIKNMCEQYDNDLVEISDHGSIWDDICLDYEGRVFSLNGKTPGYDTLDQYPPFHANCEHSMAPTSEEAIKWRGTH